MTPLPSVDRVLFVSEYTAEVFARYNGWVVNRYDTTGHAAVLGIGAATYTQDPACNSNLPYTCLNIDLASSTDSDAGSLLLTSVNATAILDPTADPIVEPFDPFAQVAWSKVVATPDACYPTKTGQIDTRSVIGVYEARSSGNFCCGRTYTTREQTNVVASSFTVSSHTVTLTRCGTGSGVTELNVDIDSSVGFCNTMNLGVVPGPSSRWGWIGKVTYTLFDSLGAQQIKESDFAMFAGGPFGGAARGGRLSGTFGAALDAVIGANAPNTGGQSMRATGDITLNAPLIAAWLDSQTVPMTVDLLVEVTMGNFTQTGDHNGDGSVNWLDRAAHTAAWGTAYDSTGYRPEMDWNADGEVTKVDFYGLEGAWLNANTCPADIGTTGNVFAPDGLLNSNDWSVFTGRYYASEPDADIGGTAGTPGGDGQFDSNDWIVFTDWYYAGCN